MRSPRKQAIYEFANANSAKRDYWIRKNSFFHQQDYKYLQFLIPEGSRVIDLGCGNGDLLNYLRPIEGVGVDFSESTIKIAQKKYPDLKFLCLDIEMTEFYEQGLPEYDFILISDTIGALEDCQETLRKLHQISNNETRIILTYYSRIWEPILSLAKLLGLKMPEPRQNWLATEDIINFLTLANFEIVKTEWRQLIPLRLFGIGSLINRYIAPLPIIRRFCLRNYVVARPKAINKSQLQLSTTILIPCRNERGNIESAVQRIPKFCEDIEIIFVEGHSQDGTYEEIIRVKNKYPSLDIKVYIQDGKGKGDAVRKGFSHASKDILMILDADLTTPPEALPKFYNVINSGTGEFINGTRLIYPMENEAMRFLNLLANHIFSMLFSWLLNQRLTDTLCGTKVISNNNYKKLIANRAYFGDFDPFGDFDLIFGASKMNLKIIEIPVTYASRTYGSTQISRFIHGLLLLKMVIFAFKKLKAF